jgi:WD40 repeat protein
LPFQGPVNVVLAQVLNVEPPPPSELRPGLDPELETVCQRAMAKTIETRFASMEELDKALTAYLRKGRTNTGKMTVVGIAAEKPTQAGTQLDLKPKESVEVDPPVSANGMWFRHRWRWLAGGAAAIILGLFLAFAVFGPTSQNDQSGADGGPIWTDLTEFTLTSARFFFGRDKTWFAINSLPNVGVAHHANISTHCKRYSRNGKWIIICPDGKYPAEIVYRFNEPVREFRATVALMHPTGHVDVRVYADDTLIHQTKDLLGSAEGRQINARSDAFTELRIEVERRGVAGGNQLLIADPEIFTDPETIPKPVVDSRETGQCLQIWQHETTVSDLRFSPDNRLLITGHISGAVFVWDLETGKRMRPFTGVAQSVKLAVSADGERILAAGKFGAHIWNFKNGKELNSITFEPPAGSVRVAATPSGFQALIARKRRYQLWDIETDKSIGIEFRHDRWAFAWLQLSPDGNRAFYIGRDGSRTVWDLQTAKGDIQKITQLPGCFEPQQRAPLDTGISATVSEDSRLGIAVGADGLAVLCDLIDFKEVRLLKGHTSAVRSAAISIDNRIGLTGGGVRKTTKLRSAQPDYSIRMWNLETGTELKRLEGHTRNVNRLAISPNGKLAASFSIDRTIRVWRLPDIENPTNGKP